MLTIRVGHLYGFLALRGAEDMNNLSFKSTNFIGQGIINK